MLRKPEAGAVQAVPGPAADRSRRKTRNRIGRNRVGAAFRTVFPLIPSVIHRCLFLIG